MAVIGLSQVQHLMSSLSLTVRAAHKDLGKVDFSTPEGLLAGLGYAITRPFFLHG